MISEGVGNIMVPFDCTCIILGTSKAISVDFRNNVCIISVVPADEHQKEATKVRVVLSITGVFIVCFDVTVPLSVLCNREL